MSPEEKLARKMLAKIFTNPETVDFWLTTPNPFFGETTPRHMFEIGRGHKVLTFIKSQLEENERNE